MGINIFSFDLQNLIASVKFYCYFIKSNIVFMFPPSMNKISFEQINKKNSNQKWFFLIGMLIVIVAIFHYSTPVRLHQFHELYRILFYLPIILAAFRYQLKGALTISAIIIAIYLPHIVFQWGGDFLFNFSRFLQMLMYLVIGAVAGILAQRERNERIRYQQAAAELERSYERLKTQSEKLAEFEEQLRASERLSVLGELAASLAHEVRNPLGSIWGVVEILQDKFNKKGKDVEFMEILVKEVRRLNKVVETYLTLSRKPRLSLQSNNLQEIVQSAIDLLISKARKQGVDLHTDLVSQPIFIKTDDNQLRQILINLILNSLAAIPDRGSITIKTELIPPEDQNQNLYAVHLSVIDNGQGIEQKNIEKIFKPFYTTKEEGTGLGLSIVKRIVDQNKWDIKVSSKTDEGTTITLIFPREVIDV